MVSRQFLVQQAVLNALPDIYPVSLPRYGVEISARDMMRDLQANRQFASMHLNVIRRHFRRLASQYGEASTP